MNLFDELRRRNVFRVAAAYAVVAWLTLQVGDIAADSLRFPDWFMPMLFVLLGLGFPIALILSWAFELTPEGVRKSADVTEDAAVRRGAGRRTDRLIAVPCLPGRRPGRPGDRPATGGDAARNSALARRIDALPAGPAILARLTSFNGNALVFDPADTPNFAARLGEAGIDVTRFQGMPRLSE
jgi:hypothetical protein